VASTHHANFEVNDFMLLHCSSCDVVYLDPLPSTADLKLLYEDSAQFSDAHYTDPQQVQNILDYYGTALRELKLLPEGGGRVLEVGAGLAWVSRAGKAINSAIVTVAQDVSSECAQACAWVDRYFVGTLDHLPWHERYDLISLTHVIEHLPHPLSMLHAIATLLTPGGKVFITAPFRPSGWNRAQGIAGWSDYSYLHVPAHITYFSRRWFANNAKALGLSIEHWDDTHEEGQAFALVLRKDQE